MTSQEGSTRTQRNRLAHGGRVDRLKPLNFTFDGGRYQGYEGDTVASALLANGVSVVGRSFKYHRPRGIVGCGPEEPNALFQIGTRAKTTPNLRATEVELYEGLEAKSVNAWPSANRDLGAAVGFFSPFLAPGFYYKTFMWPARMWKTYERLIRRTAGLGVAPREPDPDEYDRMNTHCDVLVVGGGPAGLAAALEAGRTGARVVIADEQKEFGGSLLSGRQLIGGAPAMDWVAAAVAELRVMEEVRLLVRSTVTGYYDHNFLTILQKTTGLPATTEQGSSERVWRVRAGRVIIAAGAIERPLVFSNNDRPGVMLASAVSAYVNRYAVAPGAKPLIFTNNDSAYQTALDLVDAGVDLAGVVDVRPEPRGPLPAKVKEHGVRVIGGHAIIDVRGGKRVKSVEVRKIDDAGDGVEGPARRITCDLVAHSGGWNPTVHLHGQSGGTTRFDEAKGCFVPAEVTQAQQSAGSCRGSFALTDCINEGSAAGAEAAMSAGWGNGSVSIKVSAVDDEAQEPIRTIWVVPSERPPARERKQFVDFQEDVTAGDIVRSAAEGYDSVPLISRYTTLGFGTDQGKLGNVNGMGVLSNHLGADIGTVGSITFRPAYTPISFGAIAGRNIGDLSDPIRRTPMHQWHVEHGARFENVGQWKRAWYYPQADEDMQSAVNRECLAARTGVALLDQSTLGKIDIQGPDSAEFLGRIYSNNWRGLEIGRCRYGLMLGEDGMVMDDGVTARLGEDHYHMFTTTGGAGAVMGWMERWLQTEWPELNVFLTSVTDHWATMSIVGPNSRQVISRVCDNIDFSKDAFPLLSFRQGNVAGVTATVFRISFTGELTYEVNVSADYGRHVWEAIIEAGSEFGITPYGTEAMHVLRAEKGYIIIGQDTDGTVTPVDLGLDWLLSTRKDFIGKRSLSRQDTAREDRKQLVGLLTDGSMETLPHGAQIVEDEKPTTTEMVGHVTSSYYSASLRRPFALALVKGGRARLGQKVCVSVAGGRRIGATITNPVFYDPDGAQQNV